MNLRLLQISYAKQVFSTCPGTGMASFAINNSDWINDYVITRSGELLEYFCSRDKNHKEFAHRATFIDHPEGPSLNGCCTFLYVTNN